jgi:hypothetical protein
LRPDRPAPQRGDAGRRDSARIESRKGGGSRAGRDRLDEAPPDRVRGLDRNLLPDDRAGERRERIAAPSQMDARIGADELLQHAIAFAERARRVVPVGRFQRNSHVALHVFGACRRAADRPRAGPRRRTPAGIRGRCGVAGARRNGTLRARFDSGGNVSNREGPWSGSPDSSSRAVFAVGAASPPAMAGIRQRCCGLVLPTAERFRSGARDIYSATVKAIFERLLTYDYLARTKLVPMVAEAMPEVTTGRSTRSASARASISRPILRSKARSAS